MLVVAVRIDPGSFEYYGSTIITGTWTFDPINSHKYKNKILVRILIYG
jgi:hypothetical protein